MVNYKLVLKRIRSNEKRRVFNRYQYKIICNVIKVLRLVIDKFDVVVKLLIVIFMIDKLVKKNIIYDNKVFNLKFKLMKYVVKL